MSRSWHILAVLSLSVFSSLPCKAPHWLFAFASRILINKELPHACGNPDAAIGQKRPQPSSRTARYDEELLGCSHGLFVNTELMTPVVVVCRVD